jgi:hypothetical protein
VREPWERGRLARNWPQTIGAASGRCLEFVHFSGKERQFVPLGKGDAAFFAAGGAENAETPCSPLRKRDKKSQSFGLALSGWKPQPGRPPAALGERDARAPRNDQRELIGSLTIHGTLLWKNAVVDADGRDD